MTEKDIISLQQIEILLSNINLHLIEHDLKTGERLEEHSQEIALIKKRLDKLESV